MSAPQVDAPRSPALVVGAIDRADLLVLFAKLRGRQHMKFLDYRFNYGIELHPERYQPYGEVFSWDQFASAGDLLERIRPSCVVFFFNFSLDQVALKLEAQRRGITTYHLEHGFRARYEEYESFEDSRRRRPGRLRGWIRRSPREVLCSIKEHTFFWRSLLALDSRTRSRAAAYALSSYRGQHSTRVHRAFADIRRVDEYIAHSFEDFHQHWVGDALNTSNFRGVHFIGLPQFDEYCGLPKVEVDARKVILIDHQFHNASFYGWNLDFRRTWTARIADIIRRLGLHLLIKRHPGDVSDSWEAHRAPGAIEYIDYDGLRRHIPSTGTILGNVSSMQLPLAGMDHTILLTLEIHPEPAVLSASYVRAGIARAVVTFEELESALADPEPIRREQSAHKARFTRQFLYAMDGLAGERLYQLISGRRPPSEIIPAHAVPQHLSAD